jgi:mannose-1-phosphate guanylyltransferase/phosphomannomutase
MADLWNAGTRPYSKAYYQTKTDLHQRTDLSVKAAILAGGAGTRLYPITTYVPKTLLPIGNRYVIEYIIDYLRHHGIHDIVMLVSDSELELLQNHLGNGARFGVNVEYSTAKRIGTAGAVGAAAELLGDKFLVYYGDVLTNMDLSEMIDYHEKKKSVCTIAMSTSVPIEYGVGRVANDGRVTYFEEKPVLREYPISIGIDILEKEVLSYCERNTDLAQHAIPRLIQDGRPVFAYLTEKRHYDIGTFKNLEEVRTLFEERRDFFHEP